MIKYLLSFVMLFTFFNSRAQISGTVTDQSGELLSYASISVNGSSKGTSTNENGFYSLELIPGSYQLAIQYLGYQTIIFDVVVKEQPISKDFTLLRESYSLDGITINANAEDPAYAIIRKAIEKRKYYNNHVKEFAVDLYIKGVVKILDAPESILGFEVGDMDGMIDSTKQGIVYLSESKSRLNYRAPDEIKEVMYASKVAGDANGISFNQYQTARFNFYDNYIDFDRKLVSPIADNALRHYKYQLLGIQMEENRLINKIKCIPKSKEGPYFDGILYIVEDDWALAKVDLLFTGKSVRNTIFDTIEVKQIFLKSEKDEYLLLNQTINFSLGFFNFKSGGGFNYLFNNYETSGEAISQINYTNEVFKVEKEASEVSSTYWDTIRPIPLTLEESKDYIKKDSLEILWESKTFLDSVDAKGNKISPLNLLFGYTYQQSYKRRYWEYKNPISTASFNSVEGFVLGFSGEARFRNKEKNLYWKIAPNFSYGFSDKKWKADLLLERKFSSYNRSYLSISGGRRYNQFDQYHPISKFINSLSTLIYDDNWMKLFQEDYVELSLRSEIFNALAGRFRLGYYDRSTPENTTNYSFGDRIENLLPNMPISSLGDEAYNLKNVVLNIGLTWHPGMKYLSLGEYKSRIMSRWPSISLSYKKGIAIDEDYSDYDFLRLNLIKKDLSLNLLGRLAYNIELGSFLNANRVHLSDYKHFHGNQTIVSSTDRYLHSFKLLPYYQFSTTDDYFMIIADHHFDGYLTDKVGFLRKLDLKLVTGASHFYRQDAQYSEFSLGFEDIGIGSIKFLRFDYAVGIYDNGDVDHGPMFSLMIDL